MLMELDRFWSIIEESRSDFDPSRPNTIRDGNMSAQLARLRTVLSQLEPCDLRAFSNRFSELHHSAYRWDLWAAGYIIEGGCSDDGFTDFRYWLISMGRTVFDAALADAESLAEVAFAPGIECTQFEEFGYVADQVLNEKEILDDDTGLMTFQHPNSPVGDKWHYEDLAARFPKLTTAAAQYEA